MREDEIIERELERNGVREREEEREREKRQRK